MIFLPHPMAPDLSAVSFDSFALLANSFSVNPLPRPNAYKDAQVQLWTINPSKQATLKATGADLFPSHQAQQEQTAEELLATLTSYSPKSVEKAHFTPSSLLSTPIVNVSDFPLRSPKNSTTE